MIKAVIFDFDGTLSNRRGSMYSLYRKYLKPYFSTLDENEYEAVLQDAMVYDLDGQVNMSQRLQIFTEKYNKYFTENDKNELVKYTYANVHKYTFLRDDTIEVLDKLKDKYKLAVITNGLSDSQHNKIINCGIDKYFDEIIVSEDAGFAKPDVRIYQMMIDKLGLKPEECVYVGDTFQTDIIGAINANMVPIWIMTDKDKPNCYKGYKVVELSEILHILNSL